MIIELREILKSLYRTFYFLQNQKKLRIFEMGYKASFLRSEATLDLPNHSVLCRISILADFRPRGNKLSCCGIGKNLFFKSILGHCVLRRKFLSVLISI